MGYAYDVDRFIGQGESQTLNKQLSLITGEHLPATQDTAPITLSSAFKIQNGISGLIDHLNGEPVPADKAFAFRTFGLQTVRDIDTVWSAAIVKDFFKASKPLGLGMEEVGFVAEMTSTLAVRLGNDVSDGPLSFAKLRIIAVESTLETMNATFTAGDVDQVAQGLYENFYGTFRAGRSHLGQTMHDVEKLIDRVERHLTIG